MADECRSHELCEGVFQFVGYIGLLPLVCFCGSTLNVLNLLVFRQKGLKFQSSTLILLRCMAVMDLITLVIVFNLGFCRCLRNVSDGESLAQDIYVSYIFIPFSNMSGCTSVWTTVAVALERYTSVAHPAIAKRFSIRENAAMLVLIFIFSSLLLHMPYFFLHNVSLGNEPVYTDFGNSTSYIVYSWIRLVLAKMIPIATVAIVNSLLIYSAWMAHRRTKRMITTSRAKEREHLQTRVTIMTLCISTTFFMCHCMEPFAHYGIQTTLFGHCSMTSKRYTNFLLTINVLEMISFSVNFIFYCAFNRRFLRGLGRVLGRNSTVADNTEASITDDANSTLGKHIHIDGTSIK